MRSSLDQQEREPLVSPPGAGLSAASSASQHRLAVLFVTACALFVTTCTAVVLGVYPLMPDCSALGTNSANPWLHDRDPVWVLCRAQRHVLLLGLSYHDCDLARRILCAVLSGVIIGLERRFSCKTPVASIRTLGLVSVAACVFTICSIYCFQGGNMSWDASRVAAAIPAGVGFLGAGVIFKGQGRPNQAEADSSGGAKREVAVPVTYGLTTAASVWLSAACGCSAGGNQPFLALFGALLVSFLLSLRAPAFAKTKLNS